MASERNDGLIDLENLVRDIDAPEGKVASEAADPKPDTAAESSRLAGTGETVPEAVPETVPAETGLTGSEQEGLTACPIKEPKKLDESAELQPQPETLPEVAPAVALDHANLSDEDFDSLLMTESPELVVPEILHYHFSKFSGGALLMISTQEPSAEARELQRRAAVVFDLAYTRFLDLKKAEAQAREAKIEVALEKVRSAVISYA